MVEICLWFQKKKELINSIGHVIKLFKCDLLYVIYINSVSVWNLKAISNIMNTRLYI